MVLLLLFFFFKLLKCLTLLLIAAQYNLKLTSLKRTCQNLQRFCDGAQTFFMKASLDLKEPFQVFLMAHRVLSM